MFAERLKGLDDLARLPTLDKQQLLDNREAIQIEEPGERHYFSETSGSTGNPLVFYRNASWDGWHNASVMRGYEWFGVNPWDRNGYLWGYNTRPAARAKIRGLDALQNRFRMFSYEDSEIDRFVDKLRDARFLSGYSSMIHEVAKAIIARGEAGTFDRLLLVKGTSEKIYDAYQTAAQEAFGRRIISEYGAAEAGIIAFECPHGTMHVNEETCIVEEADGEIIVTNLVSRSFPILRYRLGDHVQLGEVSRCACGITGPSITEITGRVGGIIVGEKSRYPSLTLYYVFKNLAIDEGIVVDYQAVQERPGALVLRLGRSLEAHEARCLQAEMTKYFVDDLQVEVRENENLRSTDRKRRDFVSHL